MSRQDAAIAVSRFGMGASPGEIDAAEGDPRAWVRDQTYAVPPMTEAEGQPSSKEALVAWTEFYEFQQNPGDIPPDDFDRMVEEARDALTQIYIDGALARTRQAMISESSYAERLMRFWSNHFTVSALKLMLTPVAPSFEREAIRPHMFGRFEDMLLASTRHPAMLIYLDNVFSAGPDSFAGQRLGRGLNENLAREILELHTVGVDGGYTQEDVEEFARALTGWTVGNPRLPEGEIGEFYFLDLIHQPGPVTVLGKTYPDDGAGQAEAILADLARHPSTARHVAEKFARHMVSDEPQARVIDDLEAVFLATGGDLGELARAVVDLDEAWDAEPQKFKTPDELLISTFRGMGYAGGDDRGLVGTYTALGQRPFGAPSPAGWPDDADDWAGPDSIDKRIEWAHALSQRAPADPLEFLDVALGPLVGERTDFAVTNAASRSQGVAVAVMSPEFQRR